MGKYEPLETYLSQKGSRGFELSFAEIEEILGGSLPKSARRPQWWENKTNPACRHVQVKAWRNAGYNAFPVADAGRVRFERRMIKIPVEGDPHTTWIIPERTTDEEIAESRRALENLVKALACVSARACREMGIRLDMDDPAVAREVMKMTFDAVFRSEPRKRKPPQAGPGVELVSQGVARSDEISG